MTLKKKRNYNRICFKVRTKTRFFYIKIFPLVFYLKKKKLIQNFLKGQFRNKFNF